jgi:hypothetical protein
MVDEGLGVVKARGGTKEVVVFWGTVEINWRELHGR